MTKTMLVLSPLAFGLLALLPQGQSSQTKYQVIESGEISIFPAQPSVLLTFTLPDSVDTETPAYLMYKTSGLDLAFNRIYLNPQVPTPEDPTCGFPDIRDPNSRYKLTDLDVVDGSGASQYVLIRPGFLRPGPNRLLICEDGNEDDDGLFDAFTVSQIILVYTIK